MEGFTAIAFFYFVFMHALILAPLFLAGSYLKYKKPTNDRKRNILINFLYVFEFFGRWFWRLFLIFVGFRALYILVKKPEYILYNIEQLLLLLAILLYFCGCFIEFRCNGKPVHLSAKIAVAFAHAGRYASWLAAVTLWIFSAWHLFFGNFRY